MLAIPICKQSPNGNKFVSSASTIRDIPVCRPSNKELTTNYLCYKVLDSLIRHKIRGIRSEAALGGTLIAHRTCNNSGKASKILLGKILKLSGGDIPDGIEEICRE